ncbi:helix-turn-helix transcriptional regulator [Streptomyces flaveolus]|uniref:helix-turn-helix domain-containing protein n=1 Tax=Streptomyces flaveolus TaxID=67297 RepID=UPI00340BFCE8
MGNTFSRLTCKHCGKPRHVQATGRPGDYCSPRCRQAAHRQRLAAAAPADTEEFDQALRRRLDEITHTVREIQIALDHPSTPVQGPLEQMVRLQVLSERLTPDMVARTRLRGASWEQIAAPLGMSKDTARKKWGTPRRSSSQQHNRTGPPGAPPGGDTTARPTPDGTEDADRVLPPIPAGVVHTAFAALPPGAGGQDLATVLSSLQRASGMSLRTLATRSGLSAGFLSRLMTGERFPAWKNVAAIARACGADPDVLRRVWEASAARRDCPPRPASLASALRFLHQRAGCPTPWAIAITSGHSLDQDCVTALLDGTATGPWEDVERLIQVLDGEPSYFLPLWETATTRHAPPPPPPTTHARDESSTPGHRVEELLNAFKSALGPPRLMPNPRRSLATPIPGIAPWPGR